MSIPSMKQVKQYEHCVQMVRVIEDFELLSPDKRKRRDPNNNPRHKSDLSGEVYTARLLPFPYLLIKKE